MNQLKRFNDLNTARFITFSCHHNYNLFKTSQTKNIFVINLNQLKNKHRCKLYGYVVMPNHVHLVLHPPAKDRLSIFIGVLKSMTAREIISLWRSKNLDIFTKLQVNKDGKSRFAFWQRRYYDHNCRTNEAVIEKINYCHNNPVRKGLVEEPSQWPWSSYRWYKGMNKVAIEMDSFEL